MLVVNVDDSLSVKPIHHTSKISRSPSIADAPRFSTLQQPPSTTMLLPRVQPPLRAALTSISRSGASGTHSSLNDAFAQLSINKAGPVLTFVRHASHQQQGAVNKAKDGPGKRLGAKRSGGELSVYSWAKKPLSRERVMLMDERTICHPREHHLPPARHALVPRRELCYGP